MMTATPTLTAASTGPVEDEHRPSGGLRVTERSVIRAEWIKLRSVRSNIIGLVAAGAVLVALGAMFASVAGSGEATPPGTGTDSLSISLGGMNLSQLIIGVLGAVFVAGEYATGMIRTMFGAVAGRLLVLRAKAMVFGGATWVVMTVAGFGAFFAGQALYSGDDAAYALTDDGVIRAVFGAGLYGGGVALIGVALGFLLRSTAASIGTLVGTLMIAPVLVGLFPESVSDPIGKVLPSNAGQAFMSVGRPDHLMSPSAGLLVFALWVIGLLTTASVVLKRRDA